MAANKGVVLKLYKSLIRESEKLSSYNYRMYALRKTRDAFKSNKSLQDPVEIEAVIKEGKTAVDIIKRQAIISNMYQTEKLVIES